MTMNTPIAPASATTKNGTLVSKIELLGHFLGEPLAITGDGTTLRKGSTWHDVLRELDRQMDNLGHEFEDQALDLIDGIEDRLYEKDPIETIVNWVAALRLIAASATDVADGLLKLFLIGFSEYANSARIDKNDPEYVEGVELFRLPTPFTAVHGKEGSVKVETVISGTYRVEGNFIHVTAGDRSIAMRHLGMPAELAAETIMERIVRDALTVAR